MRYTIEAGVSRFTLRVTAGGLLSAIGHNPRFAVRDFTGAVEFDPDAVASSSLRMAIKAAALQLQDDVSEKDRREIMRATMEDVLEASKYPEIRYTCDDVRARDGSKSPLELQLNGQLTLHGVTRPESIIARIVVMGDRLRANGEFAIRQTDYGIRLVAVGGKMLQVKNELKGSFDIVTRRRD